MRTNVGPYEVLLADVHPVVGPNWTALEAVLVVARPGEGSFILRPQARTFTAPVTQTSEAAIATLPMGQLYTVLGKGDDEGRWQLNLWWKPGVTLIWLGGALVALGGLLSLVGRVRRERRARQQREEWE